MTTEPRYYRLRIRNAADTADVLVVSSHPSEATPYLLGPPTGDGQSFDILKGSSAVGVYTGEVIDYGAESGATPLVTSLLADASDRYHLLSRRAYWEWSEDGATWTLLVGGYVNSIRLTRPMVYAVAVGDTRRTAQRTKVWARTTSTFNRATNVIGPPVREGFGPIPALAPWKFKVTDVSPNTVTIRFEEGWVRDPDGTVRYAVRSARGFWAEHLKRINDLLRAEFVPTRLVGSLAVSYGWFPNVNIDLYALDGSTLNSTRHPIAQSTVPAFPSSWVGNRTDNVIDESTSTIKLYWPDSQPTVDDLFLVFGYATNIGPSNPLHVALHPIDIETGHWDDLGIAYDSSAAASVKAALGSSLRVLLRITEPLLLQDVQTMLRGMFGYGARRNTSGEEVLFMARVRSRDVPTTEITTANVPHFEDVIFDLDESTICNVVTARQHRFTIWTPEDGSDRPADDLLMVPQTRRVELTADGGATPDYVTFGEREQVYELPGTVCRFTFVPLQLAFSYVPLDFNAFGDALGADVFERFGRGAPMGAVEIIDTTITESIGDEVKTTLPHQVNANARGGTRCVQVVQRTEIPSGARLTVVDSGATSQLATLPTFTLAAGSDTRKIVEVTFTNAATLNAADVTVTVEVGFDAGGATPTAGIRELVYGLGFDAVPSTVELPPVDAGSLVWVRMRATQPHRRPGAWTAWASHQLDTLNAPTGLSLSEATPDGGEILATWTLGANATDIPLDVFLGEGATPALFPVVERLPAGSVSRRLYPTGTGTWKVGVRHAESPPYGGVSSTTSGTVAVNNTPTLDPPTGPVGIGENGDGVYGLAVTNAEPTANVEFSVAVEDSYDAGTYGSYSVVATVPADSSGTTTWTGWAPDDRLRRKVRARHTRDGATASSYTAEQVVWPWLQYPVTT